MRFASTALGNGDDAIPSLMCRRRGESPEHVTAGLIDRAGEGETQARAREPFPPGLHRVTDRRNTLRRVFGIAVTDGGVYDCTSPGSDRHLHAFGAEFRTHADTPPRTSDYAIAVP